MTTVSWVVLAETRIVPGPVENIPKLHTVPSSPVVGLCLAQCARSSVGDLCGGLIVSCPNSSCGDGPVRSVVPLCGWYLCGAVWCLAAGCTILLAVASRPRIWLRSTTVDRGSATRGGSLTNMPSFGLATNGVQSTCGVLWAVSWTRISCP